MDGSYQAGAPLSPHASRKVPPVTSRSQAYYWTHAWQRDEQDSLAARKVGDSVVFDNAQDAIRYLLSEDD